MKKIVIPFLVGLMFSCAQSSSTAQEYNEHIRKEFTVSKDAATVAVYNIEGSINVEGYAGNTVVLEVDKTISAKTNEVLEIGKKEFQLSFEQKGDSIVAYISEPFDSRPNRNWRKDREHKIDYHFKLNFVLKVPYNTNLAVSTVNNGSVSVKDVSGDLQVNNVNGGITLVNAKGTTKANTVNGNLTINYLSNPPEKSSYHTINGDIKVSYTPNLSADLQFKSMNGEFYTDFPDVEMLPARITKNKETKGDGTLYKLNKTTAIRVGSGGKTYQFETLNGNVYIKKQS
ncbi:hypothetical protein SAMN04515674_12015 [Pseudarcicella hirudinis]|uniref:Adhesin n=1 Tax=Pseudarcicella hirudinis TaxID=1079859 RepID=A0A1I5YMI3_9BACT|nr:hypothetical protein [Pseudarcicella hirudinis]SFQ45494.1 hypothetical protein SAMN04515674_12015 [Pseudarcicella hirudinis]